MAQEKLQNRARQLGQATLLEGMPAPAMVTVF
jgi:hypothetical protein